MKFSTLFAAITLMATAALARPSPAAAEFAVCNSSTYGSVTVAYAATWHDSEGNDYGQSQGWFTMNQDDCKVIITTQDVSAYTIYIYAYALANPSSEFWGGDYDHCLKRGQTFLYHGDAMNSPCPAGKAYGMRLVDSGNNSTFTYFLRD